MTTQAQLFKDKYPKTIDLLSALDGAAYVPEIHVEVLNDWENGATTWTFGDGSAITISGGNAVVTNV